MVKVEVKTDRLSIVTKNLKEMKRLFESEKDEEMKQAYYEMIMAMKLLPEDMQRWACDWDIYLNSGELIGGLCFKGAPDKDGTVELGYGINEEYQNKGYATEAVAAITSWAINQEKVSCVMAQTEEDNTISQKVLLKNGYIRDGYAEEGPKFIFTK